MENQVIFSNRPMGIQKLGQISWKTRIGHILIGLLVGSISYLLIIRVFSEWINRYAAGMGSNGQMMVFFDVYIFPALCLLVPSLVVSGWGGLKGGAVGCSHGHEYLGAVLGGLAFQIINIGILLGLIAFGIFSTYYPLYIIIPDPHLDLILEIYQ